MNIDPDAPAYPLVNDSSKQYHWIHHGLTIRAELAARMMAGFAACPSEGGGTIEGSAQYAVRWADALIEELNKP